jgi:hypothetical protein
MDHKHNRLAITNYVHLFNVDDSDDNDDDDDYVLVAFADLYTKYKQNSNSQFVVHSILRSISLH